MKKVTAIILLVLVVAILLLWLGMALLQHFSVNYIAPIPPAAEGTIRVACVGDSTTYGMFLWNRANHCYPAKLQALLGQEYSVRNFAANSTTVLKTGDHPYSRHKVYKLSGGFEPDIVLIMLGSNDAKPENWTDAEAFRKDYHALLAYYTELPSAPQVYVLTPPAAIPKGGKMAYDIDLEVLATICQTVREEARDMGLPVVDIQKMTTGQDSLFIRLDGVHPNRKGAEFIADAVNRALRQKE